MNEQLQLVAAGVRIFPDGRMTARDACAYIGVSYKTLAMQRSHGNGPRYIKLGKMVFYRKTDLDAWMESCLVTSTAQYKTRRSAA